MLPSSYGLGQHFQDFGHSFSLYGPPRRQIRYKKSKTCSVFVSSYRNTSGSLGEPEMLWKPDRRVFPQFFLPNFHGFFYNSIKTRRTCFLFLLENTGTKKRKKRKQLVYFDHQNVNSLCSRHHYVNSSC